MLSAVADQLSKMRLVLASGSPRRREIMTTLLSLISSSRSSGDAAVPVALDIIPSTFAEDIPKSSCAAPAEYAIATALAKGEEVKSRVEGPALIISADTIIVSPKGDILEKPKDAKSAAKMLASLSGERHVVITGCAILSTDATKSNVVFHESTGVYFSHLSKDDIDAYVASGEPLDKAGGYGIQGAAGAFVTKIDGCYWNVVGLPQNRLCREICAYLK